MSRALTASLAPRSRGSALNGSTPPPPPNLPPQQPQGPMPPASALAGPQGPVGQSGQMPLQGPQGGPQQAPPAPTHEQTVAALRHFNAILGELKGLLADPDLGKADMKSEIIDGTAKLVADRIIAPAQAVTQLATVPERPFQQKQWAETHLQQIMQARDAVVAHHAIAFAGQPPQEAPSDDDHMGMMARMVQQHYTPGQQQ